MRKLWTVVAILAVAALCSWPVVTQVFGPHNASTITASSTITATGAINANGGITSNDATDTAWGIQNQNLLDKTADETVSGSYSFTNSTTKFGTTALSALVISDYIGSAATTTVTRNQAVTDYGSGDDSEYFVKYTSAATLADFDTSNRLEYTWHDNAAATNRVWMSHTQGPNATDSILFTAGTQVSFSTSAVKFGSSGCYYYQRGGNAAANDCPATCSVCDSCDDYDGDGTTNCVSGAQPCYHFLCNPANTWQGVPQ